jgi:hypothetical protein
MHFFVLFGINCTYGQKATELETIFFDISFPKSDSPQVHAHSSYSQFSMPQNPLPAINIRACVGPS